MAQPSYATVIYRSVKHGAAGPDWTPSMQEGPVLSTMENLKSLWDSNISNTDEVIEVWTGRHWSRLLKITVSNGKYPIKSLGCSSGGFFIGTIGVQTKVGTDATDIPASQAVSSGALRSIATGMSADIGFTYSELSSPATLVYKKVGCTAGASVLSLSEVDEIGGNKGEVVYQLKIDSLDSVYWSGGLLIKADAV